MIPEEAVEAAAKTWVGRQVWQDCSEAWRDDYRERVRAMLEEAAPHIRAQALEDAAQVVAGGGVPAYDSTEYTGWLRARAETGRPQP